MSDSACARRSAAGVSSSYMYEATYSNSSEPAKGEAAGVSTSTTATSRDAIRPISPRRAGRSNQSLSTSRYVSRITGKLP